MKQLPLLDAPPVLETPVMRDILVAVSALPAALFYRNNVGLARTLDGRYIRFGVPGSADILGCYRGRAVAIETKRPRGGRFEAHQQDFAAAWRRAGGVYVLAYSVSEAMAALEGM